MAPSNPQNQNLFTIRLKRETIRDGIPQQIGTPLAEIQLPSALEPNDLAEALAATNELNDEV